VRHVVNLCDLATHSDGSREKAIKDLLHRSADKLDEWMCSGILGSLKIPIAWVNEARVSILLSSSLKHSPFCVGCICYLRRQNFRSLPIVLECRIVSAGSRPCCR
jgi:hypothetical protein